MYSQPQQKKIVEFFSKSTVVSSPKPRKQKNSKLNTPSKEQKQVIKYLENSNVICDSVAGSGKTTTVLNVAKHFPLEKILLLTYNSNLKIETREKATSLMINNLEVHSYHSFCVKYYDNEAFKDDKIKLVVDKDFNTRRQQYYHMLIIDECQDMTPLYYRLVKKIYRDNSRNEAKICVLGDRYQSIYDFAMADPRFISFADRIFTFNEAKWNKVVFNRSFRITKEMSLFVNELLGYNRITSEKSSGKKPLYLICDSFNPYKNILLIIKKALEKYKPEDIAILAPSLRSANTPCRKLENAIKDKMDIPVYVPISDEEKPDASILNNKLVFLTFHQSKGLERKFVIVYSFDADYFKFYKRDADPNFCSNELYVAITRASEHLILVHHHRNKPLKFINMETIENVVDMRHCNKLEISPLPSPTFNSPFSELSVTNLLRHLSDEVINKAYLHFKSKQVKKKGKYIDLPLKVKEGDNYEAVAEINGIAIPSLYEHLTQGKMTIQRTLLDKQIDLTKNQYDKFKNAKLDVSLLLELAVYYNALVSGYKFKTKQITKFNWLEEKKVERCLERIASLELSKKVEFEKELDTQVDLKKLFGFADIVDSNRLFELKCTKTLEKEHFIQLALYTYMLHEFKNSIVKPILYNILTDEMYEIEYDTDDLKKLIKYLFYEKFAVKKKLTDEEFLEMVKNLS